MWKDLTEPWKIAFSQAWQAYVEGSIPIGATLFDENGNCLGQARNGRNLQNVKNPWIRHAENTLLWETELPAEQLKSIRSATLYTTMEPCPMCMGTCVMGNIRHLRYAARDPYCGAVHFKDTDPYIESKHLDYTLQGGEQEFVQTALQSIHELRNGGDGGKVLADFERLLPGAVTAARALQEKVQEFAQEKAPMEAVYDAICAYFG